MRTNFTAEVWPLKIVTALGATAKCLASTWHNSALALPFSGAATILTFSVPSAISPASPLEELRGMTFTRTVLATPLLAATIGAVAIRTQQQWQMKPLAGIAHLERDRDRGVKGMRHIRRHVEHHAVDALRRRLAKIHHPAVLAGDAVPHFAPALAGDKKVQLNRDASRGCPASGVVHMRCDHFFSVMSNSAPSTSSTWRITALRTSTAAFVVSKVASAMRSMVFPGPTVSGGASTSFTFAPIAGNASNIVSTSPRDTSVPFSGVSL